MNRNVYATAVSQGATPLNIACEPKESGPFWQMVYVVESRHLSTSAEKIECDDGPITDSLGKPILVAPGLPIDKIWRCAADIYLPHRVALLKSKSAVLPVGDMIEMLRRERGRDEYSWIIFSLNLIYECLRPANIPLSKEIESMYWVMQDFFTDERDIEKFVKQSDISGEQAASVLQWGLNTVKVNAHLIRR